MTQNHKERTLKELEELLGKEQVQRLFLEHYLTLVGKDNQKVKLADHLNLDDIMEQKGTHSCKNVSLQL